MAFQYYRGQPIAQPAGRERPQPSPDERIGGIYGGSGGYTPSVGPQPMADRAVPRPQPAAQPSYNWGRLYERAGQQAAGSLYGGGGGYQQQGMQIASRTPSPQPRQPRYYGDTQAGGSSGGYSSAPMSSPSLAGGLWGATSAEDDPYMKNRSVDAGSKPTAQRGGMQSRYYGGF